MPEPNTVNRGLIVPNTGDLSGAWGTAAVNANFVSLDGMLGGFATLSLGAATTITLSVATGTITPSAGPTQSENALLRFTGTLTGTATIQFTYPGFYIVENKCTVGAFVVALAPSSGTGNTIGAPPGRKCHVFFDGTDMDYVDMPEVGSALDLHGATAVPNWMQACSVRPYLVKDGTVYTASLYPQLAAMLGSTFGGNGITTFGVPDERSRMRLPLDTGATGRITFAVAGFTGTVMGAAGGDQNPQAHTHTATAADAGHRHNFTAAFFSAGGLATGGSAGSVTNTNMSTQIGTASITVTNATSGTGASGNVPPAIVSFLPLIKT